MRAHRTPSTSLAVVALAFLALLATSPHTIARGETLASIASRYGTTVSALAATNAIADPNRIFAGERLSIPSAPATTGSSAPPNATPAGGATAHVVRSGDTLSGIAARYGIPQSQITAANGLTGGRVYLGQRLLLKAPSTSAPAPMPAPTVRHVVGPGETLSHIARHYGTTIKAIEELNGLTDANLVVAGQTLTISRSPEPTSGLVCPVRGPMQHMNDWGFPRSGGRFHAGNDLFAARGTPAVAMISGTSIQRVGLIGGKQVKLVGDDGVAYYYTHLDSFGAAGRVRAGDVIGRVGSTGNAAGGPAHVHFEVHPGDGAGVNPYPIVAGVC